MPTQPDDHHSSGPFVSPPPLPHKSGSKFPPALTNAIGGVPGTIVAILTAVGGAIGAYQQYAESQAISRASYDVLAQRSEQQGVQIASLVQGQLELRGWIQELAARLERQQTQVAEVVKRPAKSKAAPVVVAPIIPPEPAPPAPALPAAPQSTPLPSFDQLKE